MSIKNSVAAEREWRAEKDAREAISMELRDRITNELPDNLPMPVISNESLNAFFEQAGVWLSFSRPSYGDDVMEPVEILRSLELAGFKPLQVTLCHWDHYSPAPEPGAQDEIPDVKKWGSRMQYSLTSSEAIAPLWITLSYPHGRFPDAKTFYVSPSGLIVKVCLEISVPYSAPRISARTVPHGTFATIENVRLEYPPQWHVIRHGDESVAERNQRTQVYRSTESSANAYLYWTPYTEPADFPFTPSQFLFALLDALKVKAAD